MIQIVTSILGTLAFSFLLNVPKRLIIAATAGGAISGSVYILLSHFGINTFLSTFLAMLSIQLFSEIMARYLKTPSTVILYPASIPLLPGSSIYYAMSYVVNYDKEKFLYFSGETLYTGIGMAVGALTGALIIKFIIMINEKMP